MGGGERVVQKEWQRVVQREWQRVVQRERQRVVQRERVGKREWSGGDMETEAILNLNQRMLITPGSGVMSCTPFSRRLEEVK